MCTAEAAELVPRDVIVMGEGNGVSALARVASGAAELDLSALNSDVSARRTPRGLAKRGSAVETLGPTSGTPEVATAASCRQGLSALCGDRVTGVS